MKTTKKGNEMKTKNKPRQRENCQKTDNQSKK